MTFGIITTEAVDNTVEHYVGEDDVLWDWLVADNYEPSVAGLYIVKAPTGYTFHQTLLFPTEDYGQGRDRENVSLIGSSKVNKALLLLVSLRFVSSKEFAESNIDPDRIIDIHIK